jgi:hypothetical protein
MPSIFGFNLQDTSKFVNAVLYGRNDYQPKARQILKDYGDKIIVAMEVRREPLPLALNVAMNIATLGQIARNNPYDKLFHLSLVAKLDDGNYVLMEKNEVIGLELNPYPRKHTESREVSINKRISLRDLLQNTQNRMGDRYFPYSARNNNCGDFLVNILVANGLATPELIDFVKQDAIKVFGDMTRFRKFSNTLTDIAGRVNVLKEGYGEELEAGDTISMNNGLSNYDIEDILYGVKGFNGVFTKDQIPKPIKKGWYIINLQNFAEGGGTHWTCFKVGGKSIEYYDAFGFPPPIEVMRIAKGDIKWSPKQIQNIKSTACGWYCIARILSPLPYQKFIDKFSTYTTENDRVLKEMLTPLGVL